MIEDTPCSFDDEAHVITVWPLTTACGLTFDRDQLEYCPAPELELQCLRLEFDVGEILKAG